MWQLLVVKLEISFKWIHTNKENPVSIEICNVELLSSCA